MDRFRKFARTLRSVQTSAEAMLWRKLRNRKLARWKFRRQHPIDQYVVDFVALDGKLVIEIDGATHSTPIEAARDAARTHHLNSLGFHVIRFTNDDVRENIEGVLEAILRDLGSM